jgi:hypothetical protein
MKITYCVDPHYTVQVFQFLVSGSFGGGSGSSSSSSSSSSSKIWKSVTLARTNLDSLKMVHMDWNM